jgi:hypothetical protein
MSERNRECASKVVATAMRACLVAAVLLAIVAGLVDALVPSAVPDAARDAFRTVLQARPPANGATVIALAAIYWLLLAAAIVGMFRAKRWGLVLGLAVTAVTVLQALLIAPHAYSGLAFAISYVSKVAWGAGLALGWIATYTPGLTVPARS